MVSANDAIICSACHSRHVSRPRIPAHAAYVLAEPPDEDDEDAADLVDDELDDEEWAPS